jgi:8-oxo-dGTP diphosphatase
MNDKNYRLSLKMLIRDSNGCFLVLKRSLNSKGNPGKWDFPGGKVDPGEILDQGIIREVFEETGLSVSITRVMGAGESEAPEFKVAYLFMEGAVLSGKIILSDEHIDFCWVDLAELKNMDICQQYKGFLGRFARLCAGK